MNIKKGDTVMVIAGNNLKDVGRTGKVIKVDPTAERVVVQGRAMVIRHTKPHPRFQRHAGMPLLQEAHSCRPHLR